MGALGAWTAWPRTSRRCVSLPGLGTRPGRRDDHPGQACSGRSRRPGTISPGRVFRGVIAAGAGAAAQQLAHSLLPSVAGFVQGQQLDLGQPDAGGFGVYQVIPGGQRWRAQCGADAVGEPFRLAVTASAGEVDQLSAQCLSQLGLGGPALQQPQHRWRAQVITGQRRRRRVGDLQIRAQSVEQSALITRARSSSRAIARSSSASTRAHVVCPAPP